VIALAVGHITVGVAARILKLVLCIMRLIAGLAGFRIRVVVKVSAVVALAKTRLLKEAIPAAAVAVAGVVARSEAASVAVILTGAKVGVPLSVTVTAGAGDIATPDTVPVEGGWAVMLCA
jgi:hypothetical protein